MESLNKIFLTRPLDYRYEYVEENLDPELHFEFSLVNFTEQERFVSRYNYVSKLDDYRYTYVQTEWVYKYTEWPSYSPTPEFETPAVYWSKSYSKKYLKRYKYFKYEQTAQSMQSTHDDIILFCYHNTNIDKRKLYRAENELEKKLEIKPLFYNYYKPWIVLLNELKIQGDIAKKVPIYGNNLKTKLGLLLASKYPKKEIEIKFTPYLLFVTAFNKKKLQLISGIMYSVPNLIKSHTHWSENCQGFFVDTRGKSRLTHGASGNFTPFNSPIIQEVEPMHPLDRLEYDTEENYEPECLVSETAPQSTKVWPQLKLKNPETYFQRLELRDQLFRHYYLDDGWSVKYNVVDSIENCEDFTWRWTYKQKRQNEWYFGGDWARRLYHKIGMDPLFCNGEILRLRDLRSTSMLKLWIYYFLFFILIIFGNLFLKDHWTNVTFLDNTSHTIEDMEKNFFPRHASNPAKAYIWFVDNYPIYLNIMPNTYMKSYALTLHPDTYKTALNKYSADSNVYYVQNPTSWGHPFNAINKVHNNYYGSQQSLQDEKTMIYNAKVRYAWEGYTSRRKLLALPYFYNLLNERRGSFVDLRGLSSSWPVYHSGGTAEGKITSLTHQYHLDIAGSIYRLGARYTDTDIDINLYHGFRGLHPTLNKLIRRYGVLSTRYHQHHYFSSFRLQAIRLNRVDYYKYPWRIDEARHPFHVSRPYRQDLVLEMRKGTWEQNAELDRRQEFLGDEYLNSTEFHERLYYRDYMHLHYSPTQQTQKLTKAHNYLKKLIKYGYDIPNNGLANNGYGIIPSFLNFQLNRDGNLNLDNLIAKFRPLLHRHSTYYNIWDMIEKKSRWKDYIEIKPFFNYMVNYDKNYLYSPRAFYQKKGFSPHNLPSKIYNGNISYYHIGNIDEDKVYLLEQYIRPKTRKKIKKKLFKIINNIKVIDQMHPAANVYQQFAKHTSVLDPMADGVIFRAGRDTPYPFPRTKRIFQKTQKMMGFSFRLFSDDIEKKIGQDYGFFIRNYYTNQYPHDIADIFLIRQYEYLKFRAQFFSNTNKSKLCMKKILKLYEEDTYNLF